MGRFTPEGQVPGWVVVLIILISVAVLLIALLICKGC